MSIEILSIGNELLSGHTVNTNASVIAQALLKAGLIVDRVTYLPDNVERLTRGIEEAIERSSFIITSGGLGPTGDDLTREIVAKIYGTPLEYDEEIARDLSKRFGAHHKGIQDQSMVPKGAKVIQNTLGTAPGFILEGKAAIFVLPGVPSQMESMLPSVCSYLESKALKKHRSETLYLCLISEQEVDPYLRELESRHPGLQIGICPSYGTLSVYFQGEDAKVLRKVRDEVEKKFQDHVYSTLDKQIELSVHQWMVRHGKTCSSAESCTGGILAARFTEHPGASDYFLGGVVSYSNHLKESALGVSSKTLETFGAVSRETVEEMVKGACKVAGADYGLATSGIAGPTGGTEEKPVGTVWVAMKTPEKIFSGLVPFKSPPKSRALIIDYSATYLLASFYRYINYNIEPFA